MLDESDANTLRPTSPSSPPFIYTELEPEPETDESFHTAANYSATLDEILSDGEDTTNILPRSLNGGHDSLDEGPDFVYDGLDAKQAGDYKSQLRDVLGPDADESDSEKEVHEVDNRIASFNDKDSREDEDEGFMYEDQSRNVSLSYSLLSTAI